VVFPDEQINSWMDVIAIGLVGVGHCLNLP
jgi:hypothetical protein